MTPLQYVFWGGQKGPNACGFDPTPSGKCDPNYPSPENAIDKNNRSECECAARSSVPHTQAMIRPANGPRIYAQNEDELVSWLRVAIRRQIDGDVLHCIANLTAELCWQNLLEASFEDVGLSDPWAALEVSASYEEWLACDDDDRNFSSITIRRAILVRTALFLARAPKSRIISNCELTNVAHAKGKLEPEDKAITMDPYREARLDAHRMTDPEPWPVRQSVVCVAMAIIQNDEPRSMRNATLLHLWGKGHLVWTTLLMLCDRFPTSYGWTKGCVGMYFRAWQHMVKLGLELCRNVGQGEEEEEEEKPDTTGLCSVVQGVLILHPRTGVPRMPRRRPWGSIPGFINNGFPTKVVARTDMDVWTSIASSMEWKAKGGPGENKKRRAMPPCVLDMTTERGRGMNRGYKHFFRESTIITDQLEQGPDDHYIEHAQASVRDFEVGGLQTIIDHKATQFRMGLCGSPPHSRSPSPGLRHLLPPGSTSSSMDEVPSFPASPTITKKRRLGGRICLSPGLQHYRNERIGLIVHIHGLNIETILLPVS